NHLQCSSSIWPATKFDEPALLDTNSREHASYFFWGIVAKNDLCKQQWRRVIPSSHSCRTQLQLQSSLAQHCLTDFLGDQQLTIAVVYHGPAKFDEHAFLIPISREHCLTEFLGIEPPYNCS
ncbi:hypothetical protein L9F63_024480, partial [Diploptera punctata]